MSTAGTPHLGPAAGGAASGPLGWQKAEAFKRSSLRDGAVGALHDGQLKRSAMQQDGESMTYLSGDIVYKDHQATPIHANQITTSYFFMGWSW